MQEMHTGAVFRQAADQIETPPIVKQRLNTGCIGGILSA
jgi:hypothetical protein